MASRRRGKLTVILRNIQTPKYADSDSDLGSSDCEESEPPTRSLVSRVGFRLMSRCVLGVIEDDVVGGLDSSSGGVTVE